MAGKARKPKAGSAAKDRGLGEAGLPDAPAPTVNIREAKFSGRKARILDFGPHGIYLSVSQFCMELQQAKETVQQRLRAANIRAQQGEANEALFRLRDMVDVVLVRDASGNVDPDKLDPYRRKAFYAAELDKLMLQHKAGELIPRIEVEQEFARISKYMTRFLDTLPDVLERDCGVNGMVVAKLEETLDRLRTELAEVLSASQDAPEGSPEQAKAA